MTCCVLDVEASGIQKAHPFSSSNKLCCVGLFDGNEYTCYDIEHSALPFNTALERISQALSEPGLTVIGHNIKYDLHWLRRYIPNLKVQEVWDTQLFAYLESDQTWVMPSLNECLLRGGLEPKTDLVKKEYWDKGLSTLEVPFPLLREYNEHDCRQTYALYLQQRKRLRTEQEALFKLQFSDLLVLQEMEFNGIIVDLLEVEKRDVLLENRIKYLLNALKEYGNGYDINWNSNDHRSVILYGGKINIRPIPGDTQGLFGSQHTVHPKVDVVFPRLVEPLEKTEREKDGFYFVNKDILRKLRPKNQRVGRLLSILSELSEMEKISNSYYSSFIKLIKEMDWSPGVTGIVYPNGSILHGALNQCVTRTGRSSSSRPNLQTFTDSVKPIFKSRYSVH